MRRKIFLSVIFLIFILVLWAGYNNQPENNQPEYSVDTILWEEAARRVVVEYMNYTLGSIPGSEIDYEKAKKLLTPNLKEQFTSSVFIPTSYCIQDGPQEVRVKSAIYNDTYNWIKTIVEVNYSDGWYDMWEFRVVPVEGDRFWINEIKCLNINF